MLLLKLVLVPFFLLLVSLAGRRWGASTAGWLAGLPIVAGPILFFIAVDHGPLYAAGAASAALGAILSTAAFGAAYAQACRRLAWPMALAVALLSWVSAATLLSLLPPALGLSVGAALATLLVAPRLFPAAPAVAPSRSASSSRGELAVRMGAGALLTLGVTLASAQVGPRWSGLLAVFPLLGSVLAVFSHRGQGAVFAVVLLRGMVTGFYAFASFCLVLALALPRLGTGLSFLLASASALAVQAMSRRHVNVVR